MRPHLKTREELARMRAAGLLVWEAHQRVRGLARPGVSTAEINADVEAFLAERGAAPLFKGVPGPTPFPAAACISVNEQVVHGIPGPRVLQDGDVVSVDIGVRLDGWCGDAAYTYPVGEVSGEAERLLRVTEETLRLALRLLPRKRRWSEVAAEMARYVRRQGFSVVQELAGHSIGRELWEGLHVPNFSNAAYLRRGDFLLQPGMVLAIEPMVNAGSRHVAVLEDGWTIVTQDGRPSAHVEHTVALTEEGAVPLTVGPNGEGWALP